MTVAGEGHSNEEGTSGLQCDQAKHGWLPRLKPFPCRLKLWVAELIWLASG